MKRKFVIDEEISFVNEHDILKTQVYADSLVKIIKNTPHDKVFTIGLFGNWGSGKSSIIKTAKDIIEQEDDKVKFITYDAWKYVNDSFRRMFLLKIQQELKQGQTEVMQRFYQSESAEAEPKTYVSTNYLGILCLALLAVLIIVNFSPLEPETKVPVSTGISLLGLLIAIFGGIFQKLKIQINKPIVFAPEQFEQCFREMISKALKKRNIIDNVFAKTKDYVELGECSITNLNKLVIVIDNIDRCHNEMAYQLLTDIKTFLSDEKLNVVFVIPVDDVALKQNLFSKNDLCNEKEEFLRKFFNVTLRIKPHQTTELNSYARELNDRNKLGFNANTIALCSKEFATNPRRIIQLFNNLSSELCQYSSEFIEKNESAICAILILREEYPDYYKKILNDPYVFKNGIIGEKEKGPVSFMRFVSPIARKIEIKDLLKILTNSEAVFDAIPEEIKNAINSYDFNKTIELIKLKPDLKDEIFALIVRNVQDDIKSDSDVQIINSLEFISSLSVSVDMASVYLQELDVLYQPHYKNSILEQIDKTKLKNLCRFALMLDNNGFKDLKEHIIQHVTNIGEENENIDESFNKAVFTVFNTDEDSKQLSKLATKIFNTVDIYTDIQYTENQLNSLFSEELVQAHINAITIGDNKETEKLLWLFEHKKNVTEDSYSLLFDKIHQLIGTTTSKAGSDILECILYTMKYLQFIENSEINNTDKLVTLNQKLENRRDRYNNIVYTLDEYKTDTLNLHRIIDYIIHVYRISNGVITSDQVKKMCLYDREYTYSILINLQQNGYDLEPFHNAIMSDNDYSLSDLIPLTEHCLFLKDGKEQSVIDTNTIKNKLSSLLDNIKNVEVQKSIERLIVDNPIKEWVTENIIERDAQYINILPGALLKLAVNSFTEETAYSYEGNMEFLAVIASKGSVKQKNELVKILIDNVNKKKYINETINILETIELSKDYNLKMICGALQSYKNGTEITDNRIDKLIEKYSSH